MAEPNPTDHDLLITLRAHVDDLRTWKATLEAHLDAKFEAMNQRLDDKVGALDAKLDSKVDELQQHVDQGFTVLRGEMAQTLHRLKLALPTWANVALGTLLTVIGLLIGLLGHPWP